MRLTPWILAASIPFLGTSAASAKEFLPGDLFVCGATQCREVSAEHARAFSSLLWGDRPVTRTATPRVGSPVYQLRFRNGPAGVMLNATAFRVHGLNCSRFQRDKWYRLSRGLRGLTTGLTPKHLRSPVPRSC